MWLVKNFPCTQIFQRRLWSQKPTTQCSWSINLLQTRLRISPRNELTSRNAALIYGRRRCIHSFVQLDQWQVSIPFLFIWFRTNREENQHLQVVTSRSVAEHRSAAGRPRVRVQEVDSGVVHDLVGQESRLRSVCEGLGRLAGRRAAESV